MAGRLYYEYKLGMDRVQNNGICMCVRTGTSMEGKNMTGETAFVRETGPAHLSGFNRDITTVFINLDLIEN